MHKSHHSEILSGIAKDSEFGILNMESYGRRYGYELNFLYSIGNITEEDLTEAVTDAVVKAGLKCYESVLNGEYADHVASTEALAYVLSNEKILLNDLKKWKGIAFDYGETIKEFCNRYGDDNLIENLKNKLMDPDELKLGDFDPHPVCDDPSH